MSNLAGIDESLSEQVIQMSTLVTSGECYALPASLAQERLLLLNEREPGNPTWNVAVRFMLDGAVDPTLLEDALHQVVDRHEILRTSFARHDEHWVQIIKPTETVVLHIFDLRRLVEDDKSTEIERISLTEARLRFSLDKGPLFRFSLLQISEAQQLLLTTFHQTVVDLWSIGIITRELALRYEARSRIQVAHAFPELPIQYGDYSVWERDHGEDSGRNSAIEFWRQQLSDLPGPQMPSDFQAAGSYGEGAIVGQVLPVTLTERLQQMASQAKTTFFNLMFAATCVVLHKNSGQDCFGVGTQVPGRNSEELEGVIGPFVNTVVLRADLSENPKFQEFLCRVHGTSTQAIENSSVRWEEVLHALRPNEYPDHQGLFRVNFICQRMIQQQQFAGSTLTSYPAKSPGAMYDLNIFLIQRKDGWRLGCEYRTDLFRSDTITTFLDHYRRTLEQIAESPDSRISDLPDCERQPVSSPEMSGPVDASEHFVFPASMSQRRFWAVEQLASGNPAVNLRAAVRLNGPLCVDTLRGSVTHLIDRHEILRTTFKMASDGLLQIVSPAGQLSFEVTCARTHDEQWEEHTLQSAILDEAAKSFDLEHGPLVRWRLFQLRDAEHVLVVTTHHIITDGWSHNVIQRDLWTTYEARLGTKQAQALPPPLHIQYADFSIWQEDWLKSNEAQRNLEFWRTQLLPSPPVLNLAFKLDKTNGSVAPQPDGSFLLPAELVQTLKTLSAKAQTTMFTVTIAAFAALLNRLSKQEDMVITSPVANRTVETEDLIGPFAGLVCIRLDLSCDPTFQELLERVRETTVNCLDHSQLPFETILEEIPVRTINCINPLAQVSFSYQSAFLQARKLSTIEVHPLPETGMGAHFELQFVLIERPDSVRLRINRTPHSARPEDNCQLAETYIGILRTLSSSPSHRLSHLNAITTPISSPVTSERLESPASHNCIPLDDQARRMIALWKDLLHLQNIGPEDNFFHIGGNSLLAVRLFSLIEREFKVRLPLAALIRCPTVTLLVQELSGRSTAPRWSSLVVIEPAGNRPTFFCVHGAGGNVLLYRELAHRLAPDQPFYGLQSQGLAGDEPPLSRIEDMAAAYLKEVRDLQPKGPYCLGGYCSGGTVALEMALQLQSQGEVVDFLAMFDTINWHRLPTLTRWRLAIYEAERLWFHCRSFAMLDYEGKTLFFRQKLKVLKDRVGLFRSRWPSGHGASQVDSNAARVSRIWKLNDAAIVKYVPGQYSGTILDFRPMTNYSRYDCPAADWGMVAAKHEIITLPVMPAAMLMEPFVARLADAFRSRMDSVIRARAAKEPA